MGIEEKSKIEMLKRFLSFVLCCAMVLSCVPAAVFAVGVPEGALTIKEGVETAAVIEEAGAYAYFSFTPEHTESYTFYSIGNEDTYGYVYNSRMALLASDNNNGNNKNFSITYTLKAGNTYIFGAFYYSNSDTGSFSVVLKANHKGTVAATVPASCTEDGLGTGICDNCGKEYTEVIPATGHLLNDENICTNCGEGLNGAGTCGENLMWMLDQYGLLTIYGSGKMTDYSSSNTAPWYGNRTTITGVVIQQGVTSIGNYAFYGCIKLADISIPEDVCSIGNSAFELCNKLGRISIPSNVTKIGYRAFYECGMLTSVTIPERVTSIESFTFYGCSNLRSITIAEKVASIGSYAFSGCCNLVEITLPEGVTSIGWDAFSKCSSLKSITIPEGITSISMDVFYGCSSLSSIIIPAGVTSIGSSAFYQCSSLSSVSIPEGVASIGSSAFYECSSLSSINIPEGVTSIGSYAFYKCSGLKSISIPNSVSSIGDRVFYGCSSLSSITIPVGVTSIGDFFFYGSSSLNNITVPEGITSIGSYAFYGCSDLSYVVFKGQAPSISDSAFYCVTATVLYPGDDPSWTSDKRVNYEGKLTWVSSSEHEHIFTTAVTAPTCTEQGYTTYTCICQYSYRADYVDALGHDVIILPAEEASCNKTGLTEGQKCSVCGDILVAQEVIPVTHQEKLIPGTPATCTETGLTDGKKCSVCGVILKDQETIPLAAHTEEPIPGKAATCTETGLTDGKKCSVCGVTLKDQETIPLAAHTEEPIPGRAATCTRTGLTDGKKCSVCGVILEDQETIPLAAHTEEPIPGKAATCTEDGLTDGTKCSLCEEILVPQEVIPAGHTIEESGYKEPTCTENGMSALKVCTVCHEVIQEQQILPACHKLVKKKPQKATLEEDGYRMECFVCSNCKACFQDESGEVAVEADYVIPAVKTVKLSSTRYSYDGKTKTPKVGVYDSKGNKLVKDKDYTVTYAKGRKSVGQYNVTMKGIGDYDFRTTLTFQIVPAKSKITKLSGKSKSFTASWSKKTSQVTGYQLQYSLDKNFETGVKTVTIKDNDVTSKTIKSLKSKKYYYVRIRTYKTVSGKNFYSSWSDAVKVKTK